jgi:uncharacterized protein YacL
LLYSIIQIGPEILNNTTNTVTRTPTVDYGFLQAAVTLLAAFLIFFTLGRFDFVQPMVKGHEEYTVKDPITWVLFGMFGTAVPAVALASVEGLPLRDGPTPYFNMFARIFSSSL